MMEGEVWLAPWYNAMVVDITAKKKSGAIEMDAIDMQALFDEMLPLAINFSWEEKRYTHDEIRKIMGMDEDG